jgi:hypothetical protein
MEVVPLAGGRRVNQRVYVTTATFSWTRKDARFSSDAFIKEMIVAKYGKQESGEAHEWVAYDVEEADAVTG